MQVIEKAVFSSHMIGLQFAKNEDVFNKFYYMGDHGEILSDHKASVLKSQFFSVGGQYYKNKFFICKFLSGVGVLCAKDLLG